MSEQASAGSPAQGWYTDPHDPSRLRWWDGATWTEHVHPPADQAAAAPAAGAEAAGGGDAARSGCGGGPAGRRVPNRRGDSAHRAEHRQRRSPGRNRRHRDQLRPRRQRRGGTPASSGATEKGAIAKWFSSASNIALLVILVIAIVLFILVMSGSLT